MSDREKEIDQLISVFVDHKDIIFEVFMNVLKERVE